MVGIGAKFCSRGALVDGGDDGSLECAVAVARDNDEASDIRIGHSGSADGVGEAEDEIAVARASKVADEEAAGNEIVVEAAAAGCDRGKGVGNGCGEGAVSVAERHEVNGKRIQSTNCIVKAVIREDQVSLAIAVDVGNGERADAGGVGAGDCLDR